MFLSHYMAYSMNEGQCSQISTRRAKRVKHEGLSLKGRYLPVSTQNAGMDVFYNLMIFAQRARLHPDYCLFIPDFSPRS